MTIHETLKKALPDAMRAKDHVRLRTLRSLITAMTNEAVAQKQKPNELLADDKALAVLKRAASQRKDSIEQFEKAGRTDLSEPEKEELAIIQTYLPAQASEAKIEAAVQAKIQALGAVTKADAGKLVGAVMKELGGNADGAAVKAVIDRALA
jgi:uncharacterized protein YqeY